MPATGSLRPLTRRRPRRTRCQSLSFSKKSTQIRIIDVAHNARLASSLLLERDGSLLAEFNTTLDQVHLKDLKLNPRSARKHPERQIVLLTENVARFGSSLPKALGSRPFAIFSNSGRLNTEALACKPD